MARVLIESEIWDSICRHYAQLEQESSNLSDEDKAVISYIKDKVLRQIRHDGYRPQGVQGGSPGTFT
ncbi:MAG: hypothetical protein IJ649_10805 [Oscillospiraceae bacterium]|nr:hypothetical protein [Oscillospiraceae bacterium]